VRHLRPPLDDGLDTRTRVTQRSSLLEAHRGYYLPSQLVRQLGICTSPVTGGDVSTMIPDSAHIRKHVRSTARISARLLDVGVETMGSEGPGPQPLRRCTGRETAQTLNAQCYQWPFELADSHRLAG